MEQPTQRRVSAADTGITKPAGAASSVFEAGEQAKPKRKRLPVNLAAVKIEEGVPIPTRRRPLEELLAKMKVGSSVLLPRTHALSLARTATRAGAKMAVRKQDADTSRCWLMQAPAGKVAAVRSRAK